MGGVGLGGLICGYTACRVDFRPRRAYDLKMASVYPKKINGKTYYYLREMGWVEGKPKMVSERYPGPRHSRLPVCLSRSAVV